MGHQCHLTDILYVRVNGLKTLFGENDKKHIWWDGGRLSNLIPAAKHSYGSIMLWACIADSTGAFLKVNKIVSY